MSAELVRASSGSELSAGGESDSWLANKGNVLRIFNDFIAADGSLDGTWDSLPESVLCVSPVYERLAHFLVFTYKIPKGIKNAGCALSCDTVSNYIRRAINLAADKFRAASSNVKTVNFFYCLEKNSSAPAATWLQGLLKKVHRITFERAKAAGEQQDKSESKYLPASLLPGPPCLSLAPKARR